MEKDKSIPIPEGINLEGGSSSEEVWNMLPTKIQIFIVQLNQLGIISPGGGKVSYRPEIKSTRGVRKHNLNVQFKERNLFIVEIFANQIIQIGYQGKSLDSQRFIEKNYLETKELFEQNSQKLNRSLLGRYILISLWEAEFYTKEDRLKLACSNVSLESLTGFMDEKLEAETILGFEDLPDNWLNEFLDTRNYDS